VTASWTVWRPVLGAIAPHHDVLALTLPGHLGGARTAWSGCDRTIPFDRCGRPLLVDRVPDAELVTLPGVGHVPMSDDPDLVVRTILEVTAPVRR